MLQGTFSGVGIFWGYENKRFISQVTSQTCSQDVGRHPCGNRERHGCNCVEARGCPPAPAVTKSVCPGWMSAALSTTVCPNVPDRQTAATSADASGTLITERSGSTVYSLYLAETQATASPGLTDETFGPVATTMPLPSAPVWKSVLPWFEAALKTDSRLLKGLNLKHGNTLGLRSAILHRMWQMWTLSSDQLCE